ncbi:hypothetical protein LOAG_16777 [Loa loa]|uniref:Uncharacterized protein n=1 Tax=Loa loa TaxID=7209 RepID=A0A1S0ULA7_LOALO|nr:hypothetical protein LOAG_16777 [Loa loa]EJD76206.1 hypothetical protein LOAG_16777 [Loa loa]
MTYKKMNTVLAITSTGGRWIIRTIRVPRNPEISWGAHNAISNILVAIPKYCQDHSIRVALINVANDQDTFPPSYNKPTKGEEVEA